MTTMKRQKHSKSNGAYKGAFGKLPEPVYLSRQEILDQIEEAAREIRGISARELLSSYRHGTLKHPGEVFHLLVMSDMLPENDPVFA